MKTIQIIACSIAVFTAFSSCASYSKRCSDGVCEITENGQTRYEGDPVKIAQLQKNKAEKAKAQADLQAKIDAAPRRLGDEPVRVAVIPAGAEGAELQNFQDTYLDMLRSELKAIAGIQVIDARAVRNVLNTLKHQQNEMSAFHDKSLELPFGPEAMTKLRLAGLQADVAVFHSIKEQAQTGLVGGRGQGTGVVQVKLVEFDGTFSSLYNFEKHHVTQRGDSVSDFQAAGFNKSGKYSAGELKFKRNIEKDRGAVKRYASAIGSQIQQEIRPKLPSLMVLQQIEASTMAAGAGDVTLQDAADRFKKLLGR